jgi:nitrogen fixation NifU-like protein
MSDLRDLYQEIILDHTRHPRNFGPMPGANRTSEGHNPLCGDQIKVHVDLADGVIRDIGFEGTGCAISTASASLMTEELRGRSLEEAQALFQKFHRLLTVGDGADDPALESLTVFSGVREYPMRVKCATLAWHTLKAALEGEDPSQNTVSTE